MGPDPKQKNLGALGASWRLGGKIRLLVVIAAIGAIGCGRSELAQEADRIVRAIDVLREASGADAGRRREMLDGLKTQVAKGDAARAARDACVRAYGPLIESQELEASVRGKLADPSKLGPDALKDLAEAESKLADSKREMPECERASAALRRAFR